VWLASALPGLADPKQQSPQEEDRRGNGYKREDCGSRISAGRPMNKDRDRGRQSQPSKEQNPAKPHKASS
jgi:hypothetical protein